MTVSPWRAAHMCCWVRAWGKMKNDQYIPVQPSAPRLSCRTDPAWAKAENTAYCWLRNTKLSLMWSPWVTLIFFWFWFHFSCCVVEKKKQWRLCCTGLEKHCVCVRVCSGKNTVMWSLREIKTSGPPKEWDHSKAVWQMLRVQESKSAW